MTNTSVMILCIVNQGYEEKVIEAANTIGITGGTFLNAHGFTKLEAEKFFGLTINPEKQLVDPYVLSNPDKPMAKGSPVHL